jgi:hypothetical protein
MILPSPELANSFRKSVIRRARLTPPMFNHSSDLGAYATKRMTSRQRSLPWKTQEVVAGAIFSDADYTTR